jgi:Spy/CpxP family protein refolding chaperone
LLALLGLAFVSGGALGASPYVGQESREIKALSSEEVNGLLTGQGMGFAKAAELNGFAGPAHVLELARQLGLSPEQHASTKALFASMSEKASASGRSLVEQERELDRLFASKTITPQRLSVSLREIARLQAEVRAAHLEAHLVQVGILTPEQNSRYAELRGYGANGGHSSHGRKH